MAFNPAAILGILVEANTGPANAALAKTDAQLRATAATSETAAAKSAASWKAAGKTMSSVGKSMTKYITLPAVAAGAAAVKLAMDFDKSMALIQTQAGASAGEVKKLSKEVLDFAKSGKTQFSPNDLAKALYSIESAGIHGAKAMDTLRASSKLATVGQSDLESTTKALAAAQKTGIKGSQDLNKEIGTLNATVGQGQMHMDDLVSAMGTGFLATARTAGLSLTDVGTSLAELTKQGMPATAAATRLRMTMSLIASPSDTAAKALGSVGIKTTDMANAMRGKGNILDALELLQKHLDGLSHTQQMDVLTKAFGGGRSAGAIMALLGNLDDMDTVMQNIKKHSGEVNQSFQKMQKEPSVQLERVWSQLQAVLIDMGNKLIPKLIPLVKKVASVTETIVSAFTSAPGWVQDFLIGAVVLGPFISGLGKIAKLYGVIRAAAAGAAAAETAAGTMSGAGTKGAWGAAGTKIGGFIGPAIGAASIAGILVVYRKQIDDFFESHKFTLPTQVVPSDSSNLNSPQGLLGQWKDFKGALDSLFGADPSETPFVQQLRGMIKAARLSFGDLNDAVKHMSKSQIDEFMRAARGAMMGGEITKTAFHNLVDVIHNGTDAQVHDLKRLGDAHQKTAEQAKRFGEKMAGDSGATTHSIKQDNLDQQHTFQTTAQDFSKAIDKQGKDEGRRRQDSNKSTKSIKNDNLDQQHAFQTTTTGVDKNTDRQISDIKKWSSDAVKRFKDVMQSNKDLLPPFDKSSSKVQDTTGKMSKNISGFAGVVGDAYQNIKDNTNKGLGSFGAKEIKWDIKHATLQGTPGAHQVGGIIEAARGTMVPGSGTGDKVPAMLEPGEYVLNRKAVQKIGSRALDAVNFKSAPRFAVGGKIPHMAAGGNLDFALGPYTVPPIQYAADHAGANSHVHVSAFSIPWLIDVGHKIQQLGNSVGEFQPTSAGNPFHFGPVTTSAHAHYPTDHYSGHAIDVNSLSGAEDKGWESKIAAVLGGTGAVAAAFKKLVAPIIQGPDGPLKNMGQNASDLMTKAANSYLAKHAPTDPGVGSAGGPTAIPVGGGWFRVGATEEGLTGNQGASGVPVGSGFAELLVAGANAGMWRDDLAATLGLPNKQGWGMGTPNTVGPNIGVRMPGSSKAFSIPKTDIGSGQAGDAHYKIDLQAEPIRALGWSGNEDVEVKKLLQGGLVQKMAGGGQVESVRDLVRKLEKTKNMNEVRRDYSRQIGDMDIPKSDENKMQGLNWDIAMTDEMYQKIQQVFPDDIISKLGNMNTVEWLQQEIDQNLALLPKVQDAIKKIDHLVRKVEKEYIRDMKKWIAEFKKRIKDADNDRKKKMQKLAPMLGMKYSEIKDKTLRELAELANKGHSVNGKMTAAPHPEQALKTIDAIRDIDEKQGVRHDILGILTGDPDGKIKKSAGLWGVLQGEIPKLKGKGISGRGYYSSESWTALLDEMQGITGHSGGVYGGNIGSLMADMAGYVTTPATKIPSEWIKDLFGINTGEMGIAKLTDAISAMSTESTQPWSPGAEEQTVDELTKLIGADKMLVGSYTKQSGRYKNLIGLLVSALGGAPDSTTKDWIGGELPSLRSGLESIIGPTGRTGALGATLDEIRSYQWAIDQSGKTNLIDFIEAQISLAGLTKGPGAPGGPSGYDDDIFWTGKEVTYYQKTLDQLMHATPKNWVDIGSAASSLAGARDSLASLQQAKKDALAPTTSDQDSKRADLLAQQVADLQRQLLVSQLQYPTMQSFAGMFAGGGSIPSGMWGIAGERGPEVVHGPAAVQKGMELGDKSIGKLATAIAKAIKKVATTGATGSLGGGSLAAGGGGEGASSGGGTFTAPWLDAYYAMFNLDPLTGARLGPVPQSTINMLKNDPAMIDALHKAASAGSLWAGSPGWTPKANAEGGSIGSGQWGIAGEKGAEFVGGPSTVMSTAMSAAMTNLVGTSARDGMNLSSKTITKLATAIAKAMKAKPSGASAAIAAAMRAGAGSGEGGGGGGTGSMLNANDPASPFHDAYLAICAWEGIDPVTGAQLPGGVPMSTRLMFRSGAGLDAIQKAIASGSYGTGQFSGTHARGGMIRSGQWGIAGEAGPEVVTGPTMVHSNSAPLVHISFANGMEWLKEFVDVQVRDNTQRNISYARRRG